jgi:hypothetical protein
VACTRTDGAMSICPNWVLQPQKSALRFFVGQYLSFLGGLLQAPRMRGKGYSNG